MKAKLKAVKRSRARKYYYHFTGDTLRDGSPLPPVGKWLTHRGEIEPCKRGLHASEHPIDALQYAPGTKLHLVELGKVVISHGDPVDKVVSNRRRIIKTIDAQELLRAFARRCASDVLHLWAAPDVVRKYLTTGDESIRAAAWDAARAAAWDAAWAAARDAAWAAAWDAAWAAARDAARDAAWAAARAAAWAAARAAARDAAGDAARDAARDKYREWFKQMVNEALANE